MEVLKMRSKLWGLAVIVAAALLAACENDKSLRNPLALDTRATATPTPRPTPALSFVGRWVVANTGINQEHVLWNWTVEIQSHNTATGEVRGLSYLRSLGGPGVLRGTVRGSHIDWQTDYGGGDTENGSMDLTRYSNGDFLEGSVKFELPVINYRITFTSAALKKE